MIERANVPRSRFMGAWTRKTSFDAGYLVPFLLDEILPGDHMSYDVTAYVRMATPLFPLFDNQRIDTFFFFVPNRLLWKNWAKFMGEQEGANPPADYLIPQVISPAGGFAPHSLFDHFGLPTAGQIGAGQDISVNALPLRAYSMIWRDWFFDMNSSPHGALAEGMGSVADNDGPDMSTWYKLRRRAKSHDYFTSALPWPQRQTSPAVALGGFAPVAGLAFPGGIASWTSDFPASGQETGVGNVQYPAYKQIVPDTMYVEGQFSTAMGGYEPAVYADLSQATGVAVSVFREAFLVQSLLERDARGGARYVEQIRAHFGVISPDFRVQRPEYIGGGQSPLTLTPVAQTAPSVGVPVGALGAAGTSVGSHRASFAATEHGYIVGLINVRTELSYQQGIHRMWSRQTRFDFYWPALAGLGEQAVLMKELYATGDPANDELVFGYQERWHEYRTRYSEVTGQMRSTTAGTLDAWHLSQRFLTAPTLGWAFLEDNPPMARVLAAGELAASQQYLADILIRRTATRPIPMYGTPATLGRF